VHKQKYEKKKEKKGVEAFGFVEEIL